jgi:hypothetical protein
MLDAGTSTPRERLTRREAGAQSHGPPEPPEAAGLPNGAGAKGGALYPSGHGPILTERKEWGSLPYFHRQSSPIHCWASQAVVGLESNAHGTSGESSASFGFGHELQGH